MDELQDFQLTTSNFGFSGIGLQDLGASEYTLVTIAVDRSGSVAGFRDELEKCVQEVVESCRKSPRADNLLIRLIGFGQNFSEIHGFKDLASCHVNNYINFLTIGGMTALTDAVVNGIESMTTYGKTLIDNDYEVNGIFVVITDGCENNSTNTIKQASKVLADSINSELLESLVTILVGVNINDSDVSNSLNAFNTTIGFTEYVELSNASAKTLAKLAKFVSKSISSQSKSLGTGTSGSLTF